MAINNQTNWLPLRMRVMMSRGEALTPETELSPDWLLITPAESHWLAAAAALGWKAPDGSWG